MIMECPRKKVINLSCDVQDVSNAAKSKIFSTSYKQNYHNECMVLAFVISHISNHGSLMKICSVLLSIHGNFCLRTSSTIIYTVLNCMGKMQVMNL